MRYGRASTIGFVLCSWSVSTSAAASPAAVRLTYRAHPGCPSGPAIVELLATRGLQAGEPSPAVRSPKITLDLRSERGENDRVETTRGSLVVETEAGELTSTELSGGDCSAVASALALIAALALQPIPSVQTKPANGEKDPARPMASAPAAPPPASNAAARESTDAAPTRTPAPPEREPAWWLGARALAMTALADPLALGGAIS